jgi:hypothetical protein
MADPSKRARNIRHVLLAIFVLSQPLSVHAQGEVQQTQQPRTAGGAATGGVFAPIRDALSRPITAGGFVDGAPVVYQDITKQSGLSAWRNHTGSPEKNYILELASAGVALLDYDNDGWLDIYLANGSTYSALAGLEPAPRAALYHNNHDGTFTDVTEKAGVANERWGFGVAVGDYDNDGRPDIYVTNFGKNRLYHNNGDGTFTDVAEKAGVAVSGATPIWTTAAAFGDYDRDGRLDLFVAGYVKYDLKNPPTPGSAAVGYNFCQYRGQMTPCGPRGLPGERDFLFHNNGDGTFTEVAVKAGVSDPNGYYGFAAAWVDMDDDGWPDLVVANDSTPRYLYRNLGNGTFEDISYASGFALSETGREQASMGIAVGDYDNDGKVDFYLTNFSDDYNTLFHNEGGGNFLDLSFQLGVGEPTIPFLSWGTGFIDFDNDGWKDIFVANGHVYKLVDKFDWGTTWAQRPLLFRNLNGKRFTEVPPAMGSGLAVLGSARGAAFGDLFNRGRIDVVMNNLEGPPTVLKNVVANAGNWVLLKLVGGLKSPRDATGTVVFVTAGGIRQRGDVLGGGSYSSASDQRLHFGLGAADRIDKLEIRWPSGLKETVGTPGVNRILTMVEGKGIVDDQPGSDSKKESEKKGKTK